MSFKSGFERTVAADLNSRQIKFEYEALVLPYTLHGEYHPDLSFPNGLVVELKGVLDKASKRKYVAVKQQHPEINLKFVFMDSKKKVPGTKQTHGDWARKNGFEFADGRIPDEWLNS